MYVFSRVVLRIFAVWQQIRQIDFFLGLEYLHIPCTVIYNWFLNKFGQMYFQLFLLSSRRIKKIIQGFARISGNMASTNLASRFGGWPGSPWSGDRVWLRHLRYRSVLKIAQSYIWFSVGQFITRDGPDIILAHFKSQISVKTGYWAGYPADEILSYSKFSSKHFLAKIWLKCR